MRWLALTAALCAAAPAASQDRPAVTAPGPAHAILDSLAGWWSVRITFRFDDGPEREAEASCEAKMALGGRFLEQHYQNAAGLETIQFLGYDNQRRDFFLFKLDNQETGYLLTEGGLSPDSATITTTGTHVNPFTGARAPVRIVTRLIDRGRFVMEWFMTRPDGRELRTVRLEHTRVNR